MLGRTHSKESRAAIGAAKLGIKQSEGHTLNRSLSNPNSIKIEVLDLQTGISTIYNSISAAGKALNCSQKKYYI